MIRRLRVLGMATGAALAILALAGVALASAPTPAEIPVAGTGIGYAPRVLVDSEKTVSVIWTAQNASDDTSVGYARKPAGATHFTRETIPGQAVSGVDEPFIYEPSPGVLEILATVTGHLYGWRSTNDGQSWAQMDTSAVNALEPGGLYISSAQIVDAPGGPILYAGSDGDPSGQVVQLKDDLSGVTTIATNSQGLSALDIARTTSAVFLFGDPANVNTVPFQVGGVTGQVVFPNCANGSSIAGADHSVAAGTAGAVVVATACGKVWTRTVSNSGVVGDLVTVASAATPKGANGPPQLHAALASHDGSDLTLAITGADGDLTIEHSTDGARWTAAPGFVPIANVSNPYGVNGSVAVGTPGWYGFTAHPNAQSNNYEVEAIPLSAVYLPPRAPSGAGFSHPVRGVRGSLAVTVPGTIARKAFAKTGRVTVRLRGAISDHVTASVETTYSANHVQNDLCSGTTPTTLTAGQTRTVTLDCSGGGVVIGGVASSGIAARAGDVVTFTFAGRNGSLTLSSRVN